MYALLPRMVSYNTLISACDKGKCAGHSTFEQAGGAKLCCLAWSATMLGTVPAEKGTLPQRALQHLEAMLR